MESRLDRNLFLPVLLFLAFVFSIPWTLPVRSSPENTTTTTTTNSSSGATNGESIEFACKHTNHVEMCESVLSSHPGSSTADLAHLALISLEVAAAHARYTIRHVAEMKHDDRRSPADAFAGECLDDCLAQYVDAVDDLKESRSALLVGSYDTVNAMVSAAMSYSEACEDGFADQPGYQSPLTARNDYFHKLCGIALAIVALLHV